MNNTIRHLPTSGSISKLRLLENSVALAMSNQEKVRAALLRFKMLEFGIPRLLTPTPTSTTMFMRTRADDDEDVVGGF